MKSAKIERPAIIGGISPEPSQHDEECLVMAVAIRNKDDRKQLNVTYEMSSGNVFKLRDDVGNDIQIMFSRGGNTQYNGTCQ